MFNQINRGIGKSKTKITVVIRHSVKITDEINRNFPEDLPERLCLNRLETLLKRHEVATPEDIENKYQGIV